MDLGFALVIDQSGLVEHAEVVLLKLGVGGEVTLPCLFDFCLVHPGASLALRVVALEVLLLLICEEGLKYTEHINPVLAS